MVGLVPVIHGFLQKAKPRLWPRFFVRPTPVVMAGRRITEAVSFTKCNVLSFFVPSNGTVIFGLG